MKTIIVGLGNPVLGDDGVGWCVAEAIKNQIAESKTIPGEVEIEFLSLGGLALMEHLIGFDHAIIIDAISLGHNTPGTVYTFDLDDLPNHSTGHTTSTHDTSLLTALEIGNSLGAKLPQSIAIIGIESQLVYEFSEHLSPSVADAIPIATHKAIAILRDLH